MGVSKSPKEAFLAQQVRLVSRVIITDGNGRYLLQKRADSMFIYPGCWDSSAAGHVDEGETPEEAAYRELAEEVGITDITLNEIARHYSETQAHARYVSKVYSHVFMGQFSGDISTLTLEQTEVTLIQWFDRSDIEELLREANTVTDGVKLIFQQVL